MADAIASAYESVRQLSGETITYETCDGEIELVAVPGRSMFEQANDSGVVETQHQDWLLLASELVVESVNVLPRRGHLVRDSAGRHWKALSDGSEPPFRFNDQFRVVLRVHTKLVCEEEE